MLIPNLSVLLAERRLTLTKVSRDTGLSRTTLTALTTRTARGIQFDTLNALCQYLKVTPNDLFIYRPFDLSFHTTGLPGRSVVTFTVTRSGGAATTCALECDARCLGPAPNRVDALRVRLSLPADPEAARRAEGLSALLRALPASVLADLERDLLARFDRNLDPALSPGDYSPELAWPWET